MILSNSCVHCRGIESMLLSPSWRKRCKELDLTEKEAAVYTILKDEILQWCGHSLHNKQPHSFIRGFITRKQSLGPPHSEAPRCWTLLWVSPGISMPLGVDPRQDHSPSQQTLADCLCCPWLSSVYYNYYKAQWEVGNCPAELREQC